MKRSFRFLTLVLVLVFSFSLLSVPASALTMGSDSTSGTITHEGLTINWSASLFVSTTIASAALSTAHNATLYASVTATVKTDTGIYYNTGSNLLTGTGLSVHANNYVSEEHAYGTITYATANCSVKGIATRPLEARP